MAVIGNKFQTSVSIDINLYNITVNLSKLGHRSVSSIFETALLSYYGSEEGKMAYTRAIDSSDLPEAQKKKMLAQISGYIELKRDEDKEFLLEIKEIQKSSRKGNKKPASN
jgi:hypothetical protein